MFSNLIKTFFDSVVLPSLLIQAGAAMPIFGIALSLPIIGPAIKYVIQWFMDKMISTGISDLKIEMIDGLSAAA